MSYKLTYENGDISICMTQANAHEENGRRLKMGLGGYIKYEEVKF